MRKVLIVIVGAVIFLSVILMACSEINIKEINNGDLEKQKPGSNIDNISTGEPDEVKEPETALQPRIIINNYSSPKKNWGVRLYAKTSSIGMPSYEFMLIDNGLEKRFEQPITGSIEDLVFTESVVWIGDNRVIINGEWVFDQSSKNVHRIDPQSDWIYTYAFSPDQKYLARCEKSEHNSQFGMEIRLFNLTDLTDKTVYFFPGAKVWTSGIYFSITWLDEDTLVFDGNLNEQPTAFQYSHSNGEVKPLRTKIWSPKASPNSRYLSFVPVNAYYDYPEEVIVQDMVQESEVHISDRGVVHWLNEDTFVLTYGGKVTLYKMNDDLTYIKMQSVEQIESSSIFMDYEEGVLTIRFLKWGDNNSISIREETIVFH